MKRNLESHNFVDNSSIFKKKQKHSTNIFFLNDYADCRFLAKLFVDLAEDTRAKYFIAGCSYLSWKRNDKHNSFKTESYLDKGYIGEQRCPTCSWLQLITTLGNVQYWRNGDKFTLYPITTCQQSW